MSQLSQQFDNVSVSKLANVYFDGRCVSHGLQLADGTKKSVGVILPAEAALIFSTNAPEIMETVAGACRVRLQGETDWHDYVAGQSFSVPGNSSFEIAVINEPYHYVCHFG